MTSVLVKSKPAKTRLASMTGFARVDGVHDACRWVWEARSVNGRGLELRCRLPSGFDALDPALRKVAKSKLSRGSINATLTLSQDTEEKSYRINERMLDEVVGMIATVREKIECGLPQAEAMLALRGVIEQADDNNTQGLDETLAAEIIVSFTAVIEALVAARAKEGAAMGVVLAAQLDAIDALTKEAAGHAAAAPAALKARIENQLTELLSGGPLPDERLAQEASLLALKADIREELDRLQSHVEAGRALLHKDGAVGRELDFLTQEFNREANTLCSKAQDMDLKRVGLELKRVIDQMREQVQNIE